MKDKLRKAGLICAAIFLAHLYYIFFNMEVIQSEDENIVYGLVCLFWFFAGFISFVSADMMEE